MIFLAAIIRTYTNMTKNRDQLIYLCGTEL